MPRFLGSQDERLDPDRVALRDALAVLFDCAAGQLPSPRRLGNALKRARGRIVDGLLLERSSSHSKRGATWKVRSVQGDSGDSGDSDSVATREAHQRSLWGGTQSLDSPESPEGGRP